MLSKQSLFVLTSSFVACISIFVYEKKNLSYARNKVGLQMHFEVVSLYVLMPNKKVHVVLSAVHLTISSR